jgi:hypothetical protein
MTRSIAQETRLEAYLAIMPKIRSQQRLVLEYLYKHGPHTDEGIGDGLGWEGNTVRPRRRELCFAGLVLPAGYKLPTRRDGAAAVWMLRPDPQNAVPVKPRSLTHALTVACVAQLEAIEGVWQQEGESFTPELKELLEYLRFKRDYG